MTSLDEYLSENKESFAMKNDFKTFGDTTVIYLRRRNGEIIETSVDTSDLKLLSKVKYRWFAQWDTHTKSFYVRASDKNADGSWGALLLHRYLTSCPEDLQVDHINHDTLNNKQENLRIVTLAENLQNIKGKYENNTSGIRGVDKRSGRWRARVQINKKPIHLGYFDNKELAEEAVIIARKKHFPHSLEAMENE